MMPNVISICHCSFVNFLPEKNCPSLFYRRFLFLFKLDLVFYGCIVYSPHFVTGFQYKLNDKYSLDNKIHISIGANWHVMCAIWKLSYDHNGLFLTWRIAGFNLSKIFSGWFNATYRKGESLYKGEESRASQRKDTFEDWISSITLKRNCLWYRNYYKNKLKYS